MIQHLPDPVAAQAQRCSVLSAGPKDDPSAQVIMLVSKLVPMPSSPGRFYCVGRVFSGTMGASSYQILADDYVPEHARFETEDEKNAKDAKEEDDDSEERGDTPKNADLAGVAAPAGDATPSSTPTGGGVAARARKTANSAGGTR